MQQERDKLEKGALQREGMRLEEEELQRERDMLGKGVLQREEAGGGELQRERDTLERGRCNERGRSSIH